MRLPKENENIQSRRERVIENNNRWRSIKPQKGLRNYLEREIREKTGNKVPMESKAKRVSRRREWSLIPNAEINLENNWKRDAFNNWWLWNMYNIIYEMRHQSRFDAWYWMLEAGALRRPRGMVQGGRRGGSGWGTCVYLWWIHVDVWQNQYNIVE